jgi:hypothetical protein
MSRTIRRKNYEEANNTSWDRKGRKTAGFYTEYDYARDKYGRITSENWYREPTKQELWRAKRFAHSDNKPNVFSGSKEHRRNRMKQNRMITKSELFKFFKDFDYEPMVEVEPRSCAWDWS